MLKVILEKISFLSLTGGLYIFSKSMSDSNFEMYIKLEIAITEKISLGRSYNYVPL